MNFKEQLKILQGAAGNPALISLATVDLTHHNLSASDRARLREALLAASVPHWVDVPFLAALLDTTAVEAATLVERLRALKNIEPFPARGEGAINVHEASRLHLREYLRSKEPSLWKLYSERARAFVISGTETHLRVEALYHLFAVDSNVAVTECDRLDREIMNNPSRRVALVLPLQELLSAGWLDDAAKVESALVSLSYRDYRGETAQLEQSVSEILKLAEKAAHASKLADAHDLMSRVYEARGNSDAARSAAIEFLRISRGLVAEDPSNPVPQHRLALACARIGNIHQAHGHLNAALACFSEYFLICKKLSERNPTDNNSQRELAIAHLYVGDIGQEQGRLDDAFTSFSECLRISSALVAQDPSNTGWQRDLAIAHARVGGIHETENRIEEALASFSDYLRIFENLAASDPSNADYQRELALAHARLGNVQRAQGKIADALASFSEYLRICNDLSSSDPSNTDWRYNLALAHARVGGIHETENRLDDGLASFSKYLQIVEELTTKDASNPQWQRDLAIAHWELGRLQKRMEHAEESKKSFRQSVEVMKKALALSPKSEPLLKDLENLRSWL
jgi:tetratricopeptide (TPR) repeat protein